jgi:molybdopterin-guanine dinucleotide biosynthesis protein A
MGRPKALLPFGPEALLVRVLRSCAEACDELVVVAAAGQPLPSLPAGTKVVRDASPGEGPLEGLAAGLAAVAAPSAFCVPCDAAFLRPDLAGLLFDSLGDGLAARGVVEGETRPLPAVYRTSLASRAAALVREGRRRVRDLVGDEETSLVREPALRVVDPDLGSFRNLNTPEEYAVALREAGWGA